MITLYHGSNVEIETIDFEKSKRSLKYLRKL